MFENVVRLSPFVFDVTSKILDTLDVDHLKVCNMRCINPLTPGTFFAKMDFSDILVVVRLDLSQISFNLVENAFVTQQVALLATEID